MFDKIRGYFAKLNPAQPLIAMEAGDSLGTEEIRYNYTKAYDSMEAVRNGVDRIVNAAATFNYNVTDKIPDIPSSIRAGKINTLLNFRPNPFQDTHRFRRALVMDFLLDGNIFIYFDGAHLYHLPAASVEIHTDPVTFVKGYTYNGKTSFTADEVIHVMENSSDSIYRGCSRLSSAKNSLATLEKMQKFQEKFFEHGTIPGLVVKSPNVLGDKIKERLLASWQQRYSPNAGGRRPLILDGGLEIQNLMDKTFQELDFQESVKQKEESILLALGVPYILLRGGNNANISPNLRLFYLETVYPIVSMLCHAFERFFGYDIEPESSKISALQPEMKESSAYYTTLVNGGVMSPNEARKELRLEPKTGHDDLRVPANIAGSAADPSQGGRPKEPKK